MKFSNKAKRKVAVSIVALSLMLGSVVNIYASTLTINSTSDGKNYSGAEFKIKNANNDFYIAFSQDNNGNYTYSISGNTQLVKTNENGELNISDLPVGKYYIEPTLNNTLTAQTQIINIANESIHGQATINFEKSNGSINLRLTDSEGKTISGSSFTLTNSSGVVKFSKESDGVYNFDTNGSSTSLKTSSSGKIYLKSLPNGNYVIEQKDTATGYNSLYSSNVYVDGAITLNAINYKSGGNDNTSSTTSSTQGELSIIVKDDKDNLLSGSTFKITKGSSDIKEITLSSGSSKLSLDEGEYFIEETKGIDGFDKLSKKSFTIKKGETTTVSIKKKKANGSLEISKIDNDSKKGVQGFVFTLSNSSGDLKFKEEQGKYYYDKEGSVKELKTDSNGKIDIQKIPSGSVKILEKSAPDGYRLIAGTVEKNIIANNKTTYNSSTEKMKNVFYIKDKESKEILKGVAYKIKDEQNTLVKEGVTDTDPISGLGSDGNYYVEILSVPERYSLPNSEIHLKMSGNKLDNQIINIEQATISASVGSNTQGEEFTLYKDGSKFEVKSTNINGLVEFKNLGYGEYIIKQTGSSTNTSAKEYSVTIDKNYSNPKEPLKFFTEKKVVQKQKKKISKTKIVLIGLGVLLLVLLSLAGYYYYLSKKMGEEDEIKLIEGPIATDEELKEFKNKNKNFIDKIKEKFHKKEK